MLAGMTQPLGLWPCRGARQGGSLLPQQAAVAAAVPPQVPRHKQRHRTLLSTTAAAAAADAASFSRAQQLDGIVPYVSSRAPQLKGRGLAANPLQDLWQAAAKAALRAELLLAAVVDKHKFAPYVMSALAGVLLGTGLDASTLLRHGLPPYMPDLLLRTFGAWDTTLWGAALTAAALPVTAWALRAWWRANMLLLGGAAAALQQLPSMDHTASHPASSPTTAAVQADSEGAQQQQRHYQQQQQQLLWGSSLEHLVAAAATVLRGLCLTTAAGSFIGLLYTKGASSTATAISAATGIGAVAAAAAAVVLLQQHTSNTSAAAASSTSPTISRGAVLPAMLAAEVAWLAAVAGAGAAVSAAAAVVLGGSLYVLHTSVVAPALQQFKAAVGDAVEMHVGLKLAGTQPVFDSTLLGEPVRVVVGPVPDSVRQLWEDAAADSSTSSASDEATQQQPASSEASGSSGSSASGSSGSGTSLAAVQRDVQGWMKRPGARWEALQPFIAQAAEGLYLGETASLPLYNPRLVGYWNPSFNWWQPIAEVQAKFKGSMPQVGDVFWYPVVDGAAVPTRVNAIGQDYVELDANYGVTGAALELQVQLVRLQKPSQH